MRRARHAICAVVLVAGIGCVPVVAAEIVVSDTGYDLPAGDVATVVRIDANSGPLRAPAGEARVTAPIRAGLPHQAGLQVTAIAQSLRGVMHDDWRLGQHIAGTRTDARIDLRSQAWGSPAEHRAWRIAGHPGDWDQISLQWDGWLRVEADLAQIATASDDGSRLWLDRNGNDRIDAGEWGSNGWGSGQGQTLRVVHADVPRGCYRIRAQVEEGGGGNSMIMVWDDGARSAGRFAEWQVVPDAAFVSVPILTIAEGTVVVAAPIEVEHIRVEGTVQMERDLAYAGRIEVLPGGRLVLATNAVAGARIEIATGGECRIAGTARLSGLGGAGSVHLDQAELTLDVARDQHCAVELLGQGVLHKRGSGTWHATARAWPGQVVLEQGAITWAGRRAQVLATLASPLVTVVPLPLATVGPRRVQIDVAVGDRALPRVGLGVFAADRHGTWFQAGIPDPIPPWGGQVQVDLGEQPLASGSHRATWDAAMAQRCDRSGCFLWSDAVSREPIRLDVQVDPLAAMPASGHRLRDADWSQRIATGQRWQMTVRPQPWPEHPEANDAFHLRATVIQPDGSERDIEGFVEQPMQSSDRGDGEQVDPAGAARFALRFRPQQPGVHQVRLRARWATGGSASAELSFIAEGAAVDPYVRVDRADRRFFARADQVFWPVGLTIRSVNDPRCQGVLGSTLTPDRRSLSYEAYLARCAAAGITCVEIWLSAWNLGLEWRADWFGFDGMGRYNQRNAWRLDAVLDAAWRNGIRVNLVVRNHGQGSDSTDHEWENNPWNRDLGGPCADAAAFFTEPAALQGQEQMSRYLIARYADHPAILGWKLWSEVNLTRAGPQVVAWHEQAAAQWRALDPYAHPITTHWAGDYRSVHRGVAALPGIDYICVDAYHGGDLLARLLAASTTESDALTGKPLLTTEYGGSPGAGPLPQIEAELMSAPFVGYVSGHAGTPMLWWHEWVDQGERWQPYRAIAAFTAGEDPRGGRSVALACTGTAGTWWGRAWVHERRVVGYVLDPLWGRSGQAVAEQRDARVEVPELAQGSYAITWWNADSGEIFRVEALEHPGGSLRLAMPPLWRHGGFKITVAPGGR